MDVELRPLRAQDARAHRDGEDDLTVRWLSGGRSTVEGTRNYFERLDADLAADPKGAKRSLGVWVDGSLGGYVDATPSVTDGLDEGDVNISYAVHPWARGRGVAARSVELMCALLVDMGIGQRAALRIEPENTASVRVAEKARFAFVREFVSGTDTHPVGTPATMRLYRLPLIDERPDAGGVAVRRVRAGDVNCLHRLWLQMFRSMGRADLDGAWADNARDWYADRVDDPNHGFYIVDVRGQVVASTVASIREATPSPTAPDGRDVLVSNVSTLPEHRGNGHARRAFDAAIAWARATGVGRIELMATGDGRHLYEQSGFVEATYPAMRLHP